LSSRQFICDFFDDSLFFFTIETQAFLLLLTKKWGSNPHHPFNSVPWHKHQI
jgi:uncharacterized protein YdaU (DUF1376 family)